MKEKLKRLQNLGLKASIAAAGVVEFGLANAAGSGIDLTAVQTGVANAQSDGQTVGTYVIGAVAALVVVGVIIGLVKKL